jgi:hypothetical protein
VVLVAALQPGSRSPLYEFLEMDSRADHAQVRRRDTTIKAV